MAASLLGVFGAAEGTGAVTTGSRTTTSGSLITATGSVFASPEPTSVSTQTDSKSNTYTEDIDIPFGASNNCRINLSHNIGGTRGATHTVSKADDGANALGAQEWDGVAASPTIVTNSATGNSTAPSSSVAVGAASLSILVFGYDGAATTFTTSDGTLAQEVDENNDQQSIGIHYKVGQTGTPSITATIAASRQWGALIVGFTETGGGGGPSIAAIASNFLRQAGNN